MKKFSVAIAGFFMTASASLAEELLANADFLNDFRTRACAADTDVVIFGDTNHDDNAILSFVADKDVMGIMKSCGINDLYVELRPVAATVFDGFAAGTMSDKAMEDGLKNGSLLNAARTNAFVDLAHAARESSVRLIPFDEQAETTDVSLFTMYRDMGLLAWGDLLSEQYRAEWTGYVMRGKPLIHRNEIVQMIHDNQSHPSFAAGQKMIEQADEMKALRTDDRQNLSYIQKQGGTGKYAILIGNAHPADRVHGLDVLIGPEKTQWIVLKGGLPVAKETQSTGADAVYDLPSGKILPPAP